MKLNPSRCISFPPPSVFSGVGQLGIQQVREQDALGDRPFSDNGYVQTKWVGEKLVMAARERGLPVSIYRPGRISGHSQTGVFNQNDLLYKLIIGCCHLGSVPDRDIREDILPIDYVSQAIAHLSLQPASVGQAFHLIHTQRLHTQQLLTVLHSLGYALGQVPYPPMAGRTPPDRGPESRSSSVSSGAVFCRRPSGHHCYIQKRTAI